MELLNYFFIFLFGSAVGSFLGVVVDRLPNGQSFFKGRSHCDNCKKTLGPLDLIPVFSFIFLNGKCRYCKKKLSIFYPSIEVITGLLFVLTFIYISSMYHVVSIKYVLDLIFYLFIISSLISLFFIDLKYGLLPFSIVLPSTLITLLYIILNTRYLILGSLLAALGAFLFFFSLFLVTRGKGMGFGDVVYVFFMGLILGFPKIVLGLYIAFVFGAIIALILILIKKKKLKGGTLPFGPFLIVGTIISMFWGNELINLTISFLGFTMR